MDKVDKSYFTNNNTKYKDYEIGDFTYGTPTLEYCNRDTLKIGKFCSIAKNVTFMGGGNHRSDWVTTYPFCGWSAWLNIAKDIKGHPQSNGPIHIGNDVWIGSDAKIMSGVIIGDGSIVGANALVTKDVPPYSIVGGCPAKIIKYRFTQSQIDSLLKIKWWDWDFEKIAKYVHLLQSSNIDDFINIATLTNQSTKIEQNLELKQTIVSLQVLSTVTFFVKIKYLIYLILTKLTFNRVKKFKEKLKDIKHILLLIQK